MGLEINLRKIESVRVYEETRKALVDKLEAHGYDFKKIKRCLDFDKAFILDVLIEETRKHKLNLHEVLGKRVWKDVLNYLKENNLAEETRIIESKLYEFSASPNERFKDSCAQNFGLIVMGMTFGCLSPQQFYNWIRRNSNQRYLHEVLNDSA